MTTEVQETLYVGNLDEKVTESLIYELFLQVAPVKSVRLPKDKVTRQHQGFGFVKFYTQKSAQYALQALKGVLIYEKMLKIGRVNGPTQENNTISNNTANLDTDEEGGFDIDDDFGPVVFVGNLDPFVDTDTLRNTFSSFGKLRKSVELVKGELSNHAFLTFQTFEESDTAIEKMSGKMIMNRLIKIDYALKKGSATERHGDKVERTLWEKAKQNNFIGRESNKKVILENLKQNKIVSQTNINTKDETRDNRLTTPTPTSIINSKPAAVHASKNSQSVSSRNTPPPDYRYSSRQSQSPNGYNNFQNGRYNAQGNRYDSRYQPYPQGNYGNNGSNRGNYGGQRGSYRGHGRGNYNRGGRGGYQQHRGGYNNSGSYYG